MYRFVAVGIVALFIGFYGGWKTQGWRSGKEIAKIQAEYSQAQFKTTLLLRESEAHNRELERSYQVSLANAQEKRNAEVARINQRHATVVAGLRQRPEREVHHGQHEMPSAPAACAGTSGQELARGDAEFLAGYAADAAKLEAALNQCEAAYNALR